MKGIYALILCSLFIVPQLTFASACDDLGDLNNYTDEELQDIYEVCEREIAQQKSALSDKKQQTQSISQDLSSIDTQIKKSNAYIKAKEIEIFRINREISGEKDKLKGLELQSKKLRTAIGDLIRRKNELDSFSFIEAIFSRKTLSDFFVDWNNFDVIRTRLAFASTELEDVKGETVEKTEELAEFESRERELKSQKEAETNLERKRRAEQKVLLDISKEKEAEYQSIIKEKETLKAQIRNKIFKIADGGSITFGDALALVRPYESQLGVDAAFILSVLFQESGWNNQIGGNIGQCTYNYVHPSTGKTVMSPTQKPAFLQIMKGLGRNPDTQKVSCPIPRDGAYGGAMGPAQFIPTTWLGSRDKAGAILGKPGSTVSPFVNQDAFVASGTFLRDLYYSSGCVNYANQNAHISPKKTLQERCAASKYYAGGNWYKFRFQYGESVVQRANKFRQDIETLGL